VQQEIVGQFGEDAQRGLDRGRGGRAVSASSQENLKNLSLGFQSMKSRTVIFANQILQNFFTLILKEPITCFNLGFGTCYSAI